MEDSRSVVQELKTCMQAATRMLSKPKPKAKALGTATEGTA